MARNKSTPLIMRDTANGDNSGGSDTRASTDATDSGRGSIGVDGGGIESQGGHADSGDADSGSGSGVSTSDSGRGVVGSGISGDDSDGSQGDSGSGGSGGDFGDFTVSGSDGRRDRTDTRRADSQDGFTDTIVSASGRHKRKQCGCEKCTAWRGSVGLAREVTDSDSGPASISFESLSGRTKKLAKNLTSETIGIGISALYELPTLMLPPGTADHWPLNAKEEKSLVERLEAVADMMPKRVKTRGVEMASKILPPLALVVTAVLLTKPRIDMTRMLLARLQPQRPTGPSPVDQTNARTQPIDGRVVGTIDPAQDRPATAHDNGNPVIVAPSGDATVSDRTSGNGHSSGDALNNAALSDAAFRF
jgi:hypothetical protein